MFEPVSRNDKSETNVGRRVFLAGVGAALGGALLWKWRKPYVIAVAAKGELGEVTIVQFSDDGKRLGKVKIAKVVKSEEEWRRQLSPGAFEITRHADTEIAYTGKVLELARQGDLSLHLLRQCVVQFGDEV